MDRKIGGVTLRELLGVGILAALLILGFLCSWYLSRQPDEMSSAMDDACWLALSGQWKNARDLSASTRQSWEKGWRFRAAFADHTYLEEIDGLFQELTVYAAAGEQTDFARTCALLAEKLKALASSACFSWWNVL